MVTLPQRPQSRGREFERQAPTVQIEHHVVGVNLAPQRGIHVAAVVLAAAVLVTVVLAAAVPSTDSHRPLGRAVVALSWAVAARGRAADSEESEGPAAVVSSRRPSLDRRYTEHRVGKAVIHPRVRIEMPS